MAEENGVKSEKIEERWRGGEKWSSGGERENLVSKERD